MRLTSGRGCSRRKSQRFEKARTTLPIDDTGELRFALLDFIADFANWDNSTVADYLETVAR